MGVEQTGPAPRVAEDRGGAAILKQILDTGRTLLGQVVPPAAGVGIIRGTGPGISFGDLIDRLERDHPIELRSPFEGSDRVAGGVWSGRDLLGPGEEGSLAKLRWAEHADDLPMHAHLHSDRCLIVLAGRGFFHVTPQSLDGFDGSDIRTIAARERDVFVFTRGVVHTFSTAEHPMTLLSCQLPFIDFDSPAQYTLPAVRWTARASPRSAVSSLHCPGLIRIC